MAQIGAMIKGNDHAERWIGKHDKFIMLALFACLRICKKHQIKTFIFVARKTSAKDNCYVLCLFWYLRNKKHIKKETFR